MTAIWNKTGTSWHLLAPSGFPDEKSLHTLIEEAPQMMPLAGSPRLAVVGREVMLGGNYADLIAIEQSGRLCVIEVKLKTNPESRRAVVSQVLTYAAYLRGLDVSALEQSILGKHLRDRSFESLATAAASTDQEGSFDSSLFAEGLNESLALGRFRLVIVLDEAPTELVRLIGYLQAVADKLVIDLITVSSYDVNGAQVLVPQRVEPERLSAIAAPTPTPATDGSNGYVVDGADDFAKAIDSSPEAYQADLRRLCKWALSLEKAGLANLFTYHGKLGRLTLLPVLRAYNVGLVTIWNDNGPAISFWRSVFESRAPASIPHVEQIIAPKQIGQGNRSQVVSDDLLRALTAAYEEAAHGSFTA